MGNAVFGLIGQRYTYDILLPQYSPMNRDAVIYLASRLGAAALNLGAIALFTRLASPAVYGGYLIGFAGGYIVFATLFQWLIQAHFGLYAPERAARLAGALLALLGMMAGAAGLGLAAAMGLGLLALADGLALAALLAGFVIYAAAVEIGRARLMVGAMALAGLVRGLAMLVLGGATLWIAPSAPMLLAAVGLGQALAGLPILLALPRAGIAAPERGDMRGLARFGAPLVLAFAAAALALHFDRLLLDGLAGAALVGLYGAIADLVRQSFVVVGEAVAAAYMSRAKATGPGTERAMALERAFATLWSLILLGIAGWMALGPMLIRLLLGPDFAAAPPGLLELIVIGTALLSLRAYYFAQAIYFAGGAGREVVSSLVMLAAGVGLALLLVPGLGVTGAAAAYLGAQAAGLASLMLADRRTRLLPVQAKVVIETLPICVGAGLAGTALAPLGWWWAALPVVLATLALVLRHDLLGGAQWLARRRQ